MFPSPSHVNYLRNIAIFCGIVITSISITLFAFNLIKSNGYITAVGVNVGADFLAFYTGGTFYNQCILEHIYNLTPEFRFSEQLAYQQNLIGEDFKGHNPFLNPPFTAVFYAPLAKLPYLPAFILWQVLNFGLLICSVIMARRELISLQALPTYQLVGCCFLFYPTFGWVLYGQATPIILLLYCLFFFALRKGKDFRAGFYLGLLAFKPQLTILIVLVLLFKWRWKSLMGGSISLCISVLIGFILVPEAMQKYIEVSPRFLDFLRLPNYPTWGIHSFFGFSSLLFDELSPQITNIVIYILSGGTILLLWLLWKNIRWQENQKIWDIAMAITFIWGLLISPHLFFYDLMLLLLPAAIVFNFLPWLIKLDPQIPLWIILTCIVCFIGKFHISLTNSFAEQFDLPKTYLQITTPIIFYMGYRLYCLARQISKSNQAVENISKPELS